MWRTDMENKCRETIQRYGMINVGDTVIVGVSGGADSMALLNFLFYEQERLQITVNACHINHNLRGEESDRDELFVRKFCEEKQIPLSVFSIDVSAERKKHESIEECARNARYRCFDEMLKKSAGSKLATAHTASDNEETVLLNLIRGTGTKGLCGIPPVRGRIIRPLIRCTRAQTEEYCKKNNIPYITDSSNLSENYARNRLRLNILPLLRDFNPSLTDAISRMTEAVREDSAFIDKTAKEALLSCKTGAGYSCEKLSGLDNAVLSRAVSIILGESEVEPSRLRITGCTEIIRAGGGKINLCLNKFAQAKKGVFIIQTSVQNYRNLPTQFSKKIHTKD